MRILRAMTAPLLLISALIWGAVMLGSILLYRVSTGK